MLNEKTDKIATRAWLRCFDWVVLFASITFNYVVLVLCLEVGL